MSERLLSDRQIWTEKLSCGSTKYYTQHVKDPAFPKPVTCPPERPRRLESEVDQYIRFLAARAQLAATPSPERKRAKRT